MPAASAGAGKASGRGGRAGGRGTKGKDYGKGNKTWRPKEHESGQTQRTGSQGEESSGAANASEEVQRKSEELKLRLKNSPLCKRTNEATVAATSSTGGTELLPGGSSDFDSKRALRQERFAANTDVTAASPRLRPSGQVAGSGDLGGFAAGVAAAASAGAVDSAALPRNGPPGNFSADVGDDVYANRGTSTGAALPPPPPPDPQIAGAAAPSASNAPKGVRSKDAAIATFVRPPPPPPAWPVHVDAADAPPGNFASPKTAPADGLEAQPGNLDDHRVTPPDGPSPGDITKNSAASQGNGSPKPILASLTSLAQGQQQSQTMPIQSSTKEQAPSKPRPPFARAASAAAVAVTPARASSTVPPPPGHPQAASRLPSQPPTKKPRLSMGEVELWQSQYERLARYLEENMPGFVNFSKAGVIAPPYNDEKVRELDKYLKSCLPL